MAHLTGNERFGGGLITVVGNSMSGGTTSGSVSGCAIWSADCFGKGGLTSEGAQFGGTSCGCGRGCGVGTLVLFLGGFM